MAISDLRQGGTGTGSVSTPGSGSAAAANAWIVEEIPLSIAAITASSVPLLKTPSTPSRVKLGILDGPGELDYTIDYEMAGGAISAYADIFNATINGSGQLIANESVNGYQSYARVAVLDSPGDSVFFSFTPNTESHWGFIVYDFNTIPDWSLPRNGPNDGNRVARTSNNEDLAFAVRESTNAGNQNNTDFFSVGMTIWGPTPITGGPCSLVIGSGNKLELYYNGTLIGESLGQVPVSGWKIYLSFGNSLLFPDISVGATNTLQWGGKTLDGLLEVGDILKVTYTTLNP